MKIATIAKKAIPVGVIGVGAFIIASALNKKATASGGSSGEGSFGGTDEDVEMLPYGYGDNPLVYYSYPPEFQSEVITRENPFVDPSKPSDISSQSNNIDSIPTSPINQISSGSTITNPISDLSVGDALLGASGFFKSYATALGEGLGDSSKGFFKKFVGGYTDDANNLRKVASVEFDAVSEGLERTGKEIVTDDSIFKRAISDIPFIGERAIKYVGEDVVEASAKTGIKSAGKTAAKVGLGIIPIIGTAAGAEFDVRTRGVSRPLAYTANIVGDVVGGAAGTVGALAGGVGGFVGGVGGQIAGEEAVYRSANAIKNLFGVKDEEKKESTFDISINPYELGLSSVSITPKTAVSPVVRQSGSSSSPSSQTKVGLQNISSNNTLVTSGGYIVPSFSGSRDQYNTPIITSANKGQWIDSTTFVGTKAEKAAAIAKAPKTSSSSSSSKSSSSKSSSSSSWKKKIGQGGIRKATIKKVYA